MAFPYLAEEVFDSGTKGLFDSETDASGILDYPHYAELARAGLAPWRGAYCVRGRLAGTAVGYLEEATSFDVAAAGTASVWFTVCLGATLTLAADDTVILFAFQSAGPVNEAVVGVRNNAGVYELFAGETGATRTFPIVRNNTRWYQIELSVVIDNAGANDGTLAFYVDGAQVGATITALDQGAITQAQYGIVSGTAAGNAGTILLGPIILDDLRIYPRERFPHQSFHVTKDSHVFIGPGTVDSVLLTSTSTDGVATIYDTDAYSATGIGFSREGASYIRNVTANDQAPGVNAPFTVHRGCYVVLTGTNPEVRITTGCPSSYVQSPANYVDRGLKRR